MAKMQSRGKFLRRTVLPTGLEAPIRAHLVEVRQMHERDLAAGFGAVWLPDELARKLRGGRGVVSPLDR